MDLAVGVVGLGARSNLARHAHRPDREDASRVVAVCDPVDARRRDALELYGRDTTAFEEHQSLLDMGLDAVLVLTPDNLHAQVAIDFLRVGIPVYVEKPLAISVRDCDAVLTAAREAGTKLYVGHNMRHMPVVQEMRRLVQAGAIGDVKAIWCRHFVGDGGDFYFKDWHAERRNTLSLLLQKGAHDLDVIHWLGGGYSAHVNAMGKLAVYGDVADRRHHDDELMWDWYDPENNWPPTAQHGLNPVIDVEDLSQVNLHLDNGVLASYQQCHFTPDYWRNYTVIGDQGRLENFGDQEGAVIRVWNSGRHGYQANAALEIPVAQRVGGHGGADPSIILEFLDFVRHGGVTAVSPVAARQAVAAACAATESVRSGGQLVDVPAVSSRDTAYFEPTRLDDGCAST